ncbi:uncharacterized protein FIBRA_07695 [Fibroporia radiculosa]|uniref:Uncharacterized protein n=1 Tax=Fibroporia radiculosa TaxID=599839 RepID=J4H4S0_9APHY|nr:uncharacterized protein FIBRA_07695 [Fibroporia radiculosa]CCM05474.1 predicted protein [Fibroporia radiculosa]
MISDLIVIAVTWKHTFRERWQISGDSIKSSIFGLILRDGTIYFLILLLFNIMQVITVEPAVSGSYYTDYVVGFLAPIQSILISRFILNLRRVFDSSTDGYDDLYSRKSFSYMSTLHAHTIEFASNVIGNMGAPLDHEAFFQEDYDDVISNCVDSSAVVDSGCERRKGIGYDVGSGLQREETIGCENRIVVEEIELQEKTT